MLIRWITGHKVQNNNFSFGILILFTSFVGGYMVSDYPKEFLDVFKTPFGQFISLFAINWLQYSASAYSDNKESINQIFDATIREILLESLVGMIILQTVKLILFKIYAY